VEFAVLGSYSPPKNKIELGRAINSPSVKSFTVYEVGDAASKKEMVAMLDRLMRAGKISVVLLESK